MGCTVDELGDRMSAEEMGWWFAFEREEGMGMQQLVNVAGEVLAALHNGPMKPPRGRNVWGASDFVRRRPWERKAEAAKPASAAQFAQALKRQFAGAKRRKG